VRPKLPTYKVPSLIVNGEFDSALKAGTATAGLIKGARHVVLKNAGHACNLEVPDAFDGALMSFLGDNNLMPKHPA